jgi:short-subunit dehydrogenase
MSARFRDRVVWITGASSGIGEALAHSFAREGAKVVLSARRRDELERVADAIAQGPDVRPAAVVPLDLADAAGLPDVAARVLREHGGVDVMVHNGGISQRARAIDASDAVDRRIMEVNYFGATTLTRALLPAMVQRRAGHFVVISSIAGIVGTPMRSSYCASKHALHGYFDALRAEHHGDGLRVTLVCPGFVKTNVSRNALTADGTPLGASSRDPVEARGLDVQPVAAAIVHAVANEQLQIHLGGTERFAAALKRLSPGLLARVVRSIKTT